MQKEINENNMNRLAISIMEKNHCTYEEALGILNRQRLYLVCGPDIIASVALQAALMTAINAGKRAFLGGVFVVLPFDTSCLVPWPGSKSLQCIVTELGGRIIGLSGVDGFQLYFGKAPAAKDYALQVVCNNWQAGVLRPGQANELSLGGNSPLGGVAAGALGVAIAFHVVTGIHAPAYDYDNGISLWRPDLPWLDERAVGPAVTILPQRYWLLGLGHLGQGYLWNIGLLPYENPAEVDILLQDCDKVVAANKSAGLLIEEGQEENYKTRVCAQFLSNRGFSTIITERAFDEHTKCQVGEPSVALCGFDTAAARSILERASFDFIVEASLGGSLALFDNIVLHTFPGSNKSPENLWGNAGPDKVINEEVLKQFSYLNAGPCGVIAETLAAKAISTSFVGAFAGALAVAELVRGLHNGRRFDTAVISLRSLPYRKAILHRNESSIIDLARNGFSSASLSVEDHEELIRCVDFAEYL
ncbi:hypothetical protein Q4E93_34350 [Flavitalea sp. BT771]|uniref:hypothetical protein n=1 Tax=Flavitalea sp. BT771 TaxID=3063329 RepID=UPI0026E36BD2|nr:hypothetical protein [Flavitalea sp. BT771]MDO6435747.1 hypothetical protein [Flavitalea sp. BT771]MDV6224648.1 hypothetical protein [Flavitalea sp. BT771]